MAANAKQSEEFKRRALNLQEDYELLLYKLIKSGENSYLCAYDDNRDQFLFSKKIGKYIANPEFFIKDLKKKGLPILGNETVGIGFNMKNGDSEWKMAFSHLGDKMPNFKDVKEGKACLKNYEQVEMLFKVNIKTRRAKLKKEIYGAQWNSIAPNERLAIEDLYFNGGNYLVGTSTNFCTNLKQYIKAKREGDMELAKLHLEVCLWEVRYHSNIYKEGDKLYQGIENRRNSQAIILNTYNIPIYRSRNAKVIAAEIVSIKEARKASCKTPFWLQDNSSAKCKTKTPESLTQDFIEYIQNIIRKQTEHSILDHNDISIIKSILQSYFENEKDVEAMCEIQNFIVQKSKMFDIDEESIKKIKNSVNTAWNLYIGCYIKPSYQ